MLRTEQLIGGRYEIRSLAGRGGMAEVYLARDRVLDRSVALKVIAPSLAGDPAFVSRFEREAKAAARVSHPNLVAVYDAGSDADLRYMVMEFVEGKTLADELRTRG